MIPALWPSRDSPKPLDGIRRLLGEEDFLFKD